MIRVIFAALALIFGGSVASAQMSMPFPGPGTPAASGGAWTPASLPNLVAWYSADSLTFSDTGCTTPTTNGQGLACWGDKSGNGHNVTQTNSAKRPVWQSAGLNGKNAVNWIAANSTAMASSSFTWGTGTAGTIVFAAALTTGYTAFANAVSVCAVGAGNNSCNTSGHFIGFFTSGSNPQSCTEKGTPSVCNSTNDITLSTTMRFGAWADGTNLINYVNNAAHGTTTANEAFAATGVGCVTMGGFGNGCSSNGGGWNGPIYEVIVTNGAMSSGDRALLDTYLAGRW